MKEFDSNTQKVVRRRKITIISAVLAAILSGVFFVLTLARVPNMHVVFFLVLGFSLLLVTYMVLWTLSAGGKRARLIRVLRRCYIVCITLGLAFFLTMQGLIISSAHTDESEADCIIILGAGLRNGTPSLILRRRLNAAIEYLRDRDDIPVIVTGGLGRGQSVTEADAMFRYLSERGVDEGLIWKEEASTSTRENLAFALDIMEENGLDTGNTKVAVVSSEFHLYRAKLIAAKQGIDAFGIAAQTPGFSLRALYSCREAFALASELIF